MPVVARAGPRRPSLWRDPVAAQFFTSQGAGQTADAITAIVVARVLLTGPDGGVTADTLLHTLGIALVPYAIVGPIAGVAADRWSRRRALGVIHVIRAILTVGAIGGVAAASRPSGLVAAAALLAAARLVYGIRAASLPCVAPPGRLVSTDSISLYVGMVAGVVGGSIGAAAGDRYASTALLVGAALQGAAAFGFGTLDRDLGGRSTRSEVAWTCVLRRVAGLVGSSPTRFVIAITATNRALLGASFATFVIVASDEYDLGPDGYLLALAITGVGSFSGAVVAPRCHELLGSAGVVAAAFAIPAALLSLAGWLDRRFVLEPALAASFLAFQVLRVVADATVQASIADDTRGRVFATYDVSYNLSYFAGAAAAVSWGAVDRSDRWFTFVGIVYGTVTAAIWLGRRSFHPVRAANTAVAVPGRHATTGVRRAT